MFKLENSSIMQIIPRSSPMKIFPWSSRAKQSDYSAPIKPSLRLAGSRMKNPIWASFIQFPPPGLWSVECLCSGWCYYKMGVCGEYRWWTQHRGEHTKLQLHCLALLLLLLLLLWALGGGSECKCCEKVSILLLIWARQTWLHWPGVSAGPPSPEHTAASRALSSLPPLLAFPGPKINHSEYNNR